MDDDFVLVGLSAFLTMLYAILTMKLGLTPLALMTVSGFYLTLALPFALGAKRLLMRLSRPSRPH